MRTFKRTLAELTLYTFLETTKVETPLKLQIQEFLAKPYTSRELYDFLSKIQSDLQERFDRPTEDEPRMIDLEWCEDQIKLLSS